MMKQYNNHYSVLISEAINELNIQDCGIYVDCTFGRGGHSKLIDKYLNNGIIIAIDKDLQAIEYAKKIKAEFKNKLIIIHDDFKNIKKILNDHNIEKVDGFLFDLGVSSPQLDDPLRGFSYQIDCNLDMRMNQLQTLDAYKVINTYSFEDLKKMFQTYGECHDAYYVTKAIINERAKHPIETTGQLADIIKNNVNKKTLNQKNPLKAYFQAIRIEVNQELTYLNETLITCANYLKHNGRLCVISFHSLEDKIVKQTFLKLVNQNKLPDYLPITNEINYRLCKSIKPNEEELQQNNRSRSGKLRVLERV